MTERIESIVTNASDGFGYKYAALSDIAKQGYVIPKMKTETDPISGKEYVYYFDKDLKEWIRGAQVVVPHSKGMNEAQVYGSALTYARRYTTLLALSLACEDDKDIEGMEDSKSETKATATEKQANLIRKLYSPEEIQKMIEYYQIDDLSGLDRQKASNYIDDRMAK